MTQDQRCQTDFNRLLKQSIAHPEAADFTMLWNELELRLMRLNREERLRAAGEMIAQLAEICHARAEWMLEEWNQRWTERSTEEPVLTDEMLSGFLRQSMSLNIDELLEDYTQTRNRSPEDSIAAEVEKQAVLDWLEQEEKERVLAVAHDENVSEWVSIIRFWLESHHQQGRFGAIVSDLQKQNDHLTPVAIWLALLLGDFRVESVGEEFYGQDFLVVLSNVGP